METELFGHVKGSFTGAAENRRGLLELADGGTAFFDEIGDLAIEMQVKLLRVIQEQEFRAVGSLHWRKVDLRIIAATHRDLKAEIAAGRFREDLFYRLNVFCIHLPALRERLADVPLLVDHFLRQNQTQGLPCFAPPAELINVMMGYDWPGNVRELKHCIERMSAMYSEGASFPDLPSALQYQRAASALDHLSIAVDGDPELEFRPSPPSPVISLPESERQAISAALSETKGERAGAARLLGIGRTTLYRKMKQYGMGQPSKN
jgi:DNA-binding NtrC family response regulator